jgi:hypothetical protein
MTRAHRKIARPASVIHHEKETGYRSIQCLDQSDLSTNLIATLPFLRKHLAPLKEHERWTLVCVGCHIY